MQVASFLDDVAQTPIRQPSKTFLLSWHLHLRSLTSIYTPTRSTMSESRETSVDDAIAPATCLPPPVPQKSTNANGAMSSAAARANSTPSPSAQLRDPSQPPSSQRARRHGSQRPSSSQRASSQSTAANKSQTSKKAPNFRSYRMFSPMLFLRPLTLP